MVLIDADCNDQQVVGNPGHPDAIPSSWGLLSKINLSISQIQDLRERLKLSIYEACFRN
jgi:hypothetical protein